MLQVRYFENAPVPDIDIADDESIGNDIPSRSRGEKRLKLEKGKELGH